MKNGRVFLCPNGFEVRLYLFYGLDTCLTMWHWPKTNNYKWWIEFACRLTFIGYFSKFKNAMELFNSKNKWIMTRLFSNSRNCLSRLDILNRCSKWFWLGLKLPEFIWKFTDPPCYIFPWVPSYFYPKQNENCWFKTNFVLVSYKCISLYCSKYRNLS